MNFNIFDDIEEVGRGDYKAEEQYGVLFWTLDELVKRYGDAGIFHVNDLYEDYILFAAQKLREYAINKGYESIAVYIYTCLFPPIALTLPRLTQLSMVVFRVNYFCITI